MATVLKTVVRASVPWVRIPLPPPIVYAGSNVVLYGLYIHGYVINVKNIGGLNDKDCNSG